MANAKSGWADEDRVYSVIKNVTKNCKCVLSALNGVEIGPGQTVDLRTMFRKSQVSDAGHEIASLISTGHLKDMAVDAEGAPVVLPKNAGMPTAAEMQARVRQSKLLMISDSTSVSALDDRMRDKDPEVAKAAKLRYEILTGRRNDQGELIPGSEEPEEAKPTELIRSPIGGDFSAPQATTGSAEDDGEVTSSIPEMSVATLARTGVIRRSEAE